MQVAEREDGSDGGARIARRTLTLVLLVVLALGSACSSGSPGSSNPSSGEPGAAGTSLPDPTLVDLRSGEATTLVALTGRPTVVNLWASWCTPCVAEMPAFEAVHQRLGDRVAIVGVTDDRNLDAARKLADQTGASYRLYQDESHRLQADLGVTGLPATLFVAADGTIVERHAGALTEGQLTDTIERLYGDELHATS